MKFAKFVSLRSKQSVSRPNGKPHYPPSHTCNDDVSILILCLHCVQADVGARLVYLYKNYAKDINVELEKYNKLCVENGKIYKYLNINNFLFNFYLYFTGKNPKDFIKDVSIYKDEEYIGVSNIVDKIRDEIKVQFPDSFKVDRESLKRNFLGITSSPIISPSSLDDVITPNPHFPNLDMYNDSKPKGTCACGSKDNFFEFGTEVNHSYFLLLPSGVGVDSEGMLPPLSGNLPIQLIASLSLSPLLLLLAIIIIIVIIVTISSSPHRFAPRFLSRFPPSLFLAFSPPRIFASSPSHPSPLAHIQQVFHKMGT